MKTFPDRLSQERFQTSKTSKAFLKASFFVQFIFGVHCEQSLKSKGGKEKNKKKVGTEEKETFELFFLAERNVLSEFSSSFQRSSSKID